MNNYKRTYDSEAVREAFTDGRTNMEIDTSRKRSAEMAFGDNAGASLQTGGDFIKTLVNSSASREKKQRLDDVFSGMTQDQKTANILMPYSNAAAMMATSGTAEQEFHRKFTDMHGRTVFGNDFGTEPGQREAVLAHARLNAERYGGGREGMPDLGTIRNRCLPEGLMVFMRRRELTMYDQVNGPQHMASVADIVHHMRTDWWHEKIGDAFSFLNESWQPHGLTWTTTPVVNENTSPRCGTRPCCRAA